MSQHRDLIPVTVYLPPEAVVAYERAAKENERTLSAELRRILLQRVGGLSPN